ncbi:hypothetical protein C7S20_12410 [Christiangramia fulva]|uniref:Uncharacterized protein n=1 Tax=Christiangramia fulva TaxID=2126553 RepID=A0A2R3Z6U0_9FLAO|nr:hypothetical protein [Christiangramia fulva]AVR45991.1 hypothetical protein C7S20_12410 [Christiangramia fulva]
MNFYEKSLSDFKENFYAGATTGILVSSCIGSIAAMLILMNGHTLINMIELSLVVIVAMWFNASVLAQMKPKFVFNSFIISILVSTAFIILNLF